MKGVGGDGWRVVALALSVLLVAAGCGDPAPPPSDDPAITAAATSTVVTTVPTTASTAGVPLDQDPQVIDLGYAQRILDEVSRLDSEATRILYREKRMTPEHEAILTAIYYGDALTDVREATAKDLSLGLRTWQDPPGPVLHTAKRVLESRPGCIALIADIDARARYKNPDSVLRGIGVVLQRNIEPTPDERRINPTLWLTSVAGTIIEGKNLAEACR